MKAGIDFGTSLIKSAWIKDDKLKFSSTSNTKIEDMIKELSNDGITRLNIAGIGYSETYAELLKDFEINKPEGDLILQEKKLQVEGVKRLMQYQVQNLTNYILVSIGTGTSYSLRFCGLTIPLPLGNSLSGGFIGGIGKQLGIEDYQHMSTLASNGQPLNIYVKEKLPDLEGTVVGEYVVSHFAKANQDSKKEDIIATAIDIVSATTVKDLALLSHSSKLFKWTKNVVYIGSPVTNFPSLRKSLEKYSTMLNKKPYFPENGEFSLALGAYHM